MWLFKHILVFLWVLLYFLAQKDIPDSSCAFPAPSLESVILQGNRAALSREWYLETKHSKHSVLCFMPIYQGGKTEAELQAAHTISWINGWVALNLNLFHLTLSVYPFWPHQVFLILQGLRAEFLAASKCLFVTPSDNREALLCCPFLPDLIFVIPPPCCSLSSVAASDICSSLPSQAWVDCWCGKRLLLWHPDGFSNKAPFSSKTPGQLIPTVVLNQKKRSRDAGVLFHFTPLSEPDEMISLVDYINIAV